MANYLSFAGEIVLSDIESLDSDKELNVMDLALEEEPVIQFNCLGDATESLVTMPVQVPEAFKKWPRDMASDEEELIEGSGLYIKCPRIPRCPDTRKWILKNMNPPSIQNLAVRDQYAESMRLPLDILRWMEYSKDDLPNAILGYTLEV